MRTKKDTKQYNKDHISNEIFEQDDSGAVS